MRKSFIVTLLVATVLAGCAMRMGGPIQRLDESTYRVTHRMGQYSPVKGVRQGVTDRAVAKCADQGKSYSKVREEMGLEGSLSYTLTFKCN
ncbi:MAG: hypothetical protein EON60_07495 [Alphaproteobacteria bacterium]|nr:MAG: hypothetical protein EON60_07495 [Alphaproteobacteria bacterium]